MLPSAAADDWSLPFAAPVAAPARPAHEEWEAALHHAAGEHPAAAQPQTLSTEATLYDARRDPRHDVRHDVQHEHGESPFAPLALGPMLAADEPGPGETVALPGLHDLDDQDLPVPVYEPAPPHAAPPSGLLAVAGEHRVAVHTRAGRTRRGLVRDVDLAGGGFSLLPPGGAGAPEAVQSAEVKAIFFMLAAGEKPAPGSGGKVRVTFEDGRTIEGARDGDDAPGGFFLVPSDAARTNTRRIFIARGAVQELREL